MFSVVKPKYPIGSIRRYTGLKKYMAKKKKGGKVIGAHCHELFVARNL
jgi:hypothetical protein